MSAKGFSLLGFDPGLASFGVVIVTCREGRKPKVELVEVIQTKPSAKKRHLRKCDDVADRTGYLAKTIKELIEEVSSVNPVVALCVEAVAFPMGRIKWSVISNLGRMRGLVDAFSAVYEVPIVEITPQELKQAVTGKRTANKLEVQRALEKRFPEVRGMWPTAKGKHEHAADALATCVVGLESDVVRATASVLRMGAGRSPPRE